MATKNIIELQDEYIKATVKLDPKKRNYYTHCTKAAKKFRARLYDLGFSVEFIDFHLQQAHDLMQLERFFDISK